MTDGTAGHVVANEGKKQEVIRFIQWGKIQYTVRPEAQSSLSLATSQLPLPPTLQPPPLPPSHMLGSQWANYDSAHYVF